MSDITMAISKIIGVKLRRSRGNINYLIFTLVQTKFCSMHREGRKFKLFSAKSGFTGQIFIGKLSGVDSAGPWRQSVPISVKPDTNFLPICMFLLQKHLLSWVILTHSLPMHPFSTPWKYQKTVRFSDVFRGRERVHWERMG